MDGRADMHSLQRLRLQEEMARLRAEVEKDRELRWTEVPILPYQRVTSIPSIYGPPGRFPTENNGIQLVPQPTVSPEDPLNWSWWKKHAVLAALIPGCLLSDWTLTWGTTVFELQAPEWYVAQRHQDGVDERTEPESNRSQEYDSPSCGPVCQSRHIYARTGWPPSGPAVRALRKVSLSPHRAEGRLPYTTR